MNSHRICVALCSALMFAAFEASFGAARRLDLTPANPVSVAPDYEFSPNGQWLVFRGAVPGAGPAELYCVNEGGGIPARLSADLPSDRAIASWQLGPSGSHVVYVADQDTLGLDEVYVVPMPDGEFYKVNDALVEFGSTAGAFAGMAGSRVAYIAGKVTGPFTGTFYELFSVPTSGGESVRLNGPLVTGGDVQRFVVRADGGLIAYLADQQLDEKYELYSVSASGGTPDKLNAPIDDLSDILKEGLAFSSDGSRVIYQLNQLPEHRYELYSVPATGGDAVRLHPPLPPGGDVTLGSPRFSPDGARVVYHADQKVLLA